MKLLGLIASLSRIITQETEILKKSLPAFQNIQVPLKTNVTENNNNAEKHFTHAIVYSSMKYCELYFYFLKLHVRCIFNGDLLCIINFKGSAV